MEAIFNNIQKHILRYSDGKKYLNIQSLRNYLNKNNLMYSSNYIKQELHNLKGTGLLFDAGRGWYSTLLDSYQLDISAEHNQERRLAKAFPLLPFSLWCNRQLISHYHHLPTCYVTFVYIETDALGPVRDFLIEEDQPVYLNPYADEIKKNFDIWENPYVLRPSITEEPVDGHFSTIEKILVDIFIEKDKLFLMDGWEYQQIFYSITERYRINMGRLLRYSQRRGVRYAMQDLIHPLMEPKQ